MEKMSVRPKDLSPVKFSEDEELNKIMSRIASDIKGNEYIRKISITDGDTFRIGVFLEIAKIIKRLDELEKRMEK
jgi:hypothetical protein